MKKYLLLFLAAIVTVSVFYFLYKDYAVEKRPKEIRSFHNSSGPKSASRPRKFIPRKEFHESGQGTSAEAEQASDDVLQDSIFVLMKEQFDNIKEQHGDCEDYWEDLLPSDSIIDPESAFFNDKEAVLNTFNKASWRFNHDGARSNAAVYSEQIAENLNDYTTLASSDFYKLLRVTMVCRQSNYSVFTETLLETINTDRWTNDEREKIFTALFSNSFHALEYDTQQDNLLSVLNLIRAGGAVISDDADFYEELEVLFNRMSDDYDKLYNNERKQINDPAIVYQDIKEREKEVAEEMREIMVNRFGKYINDEEE